jgi:sphingolipid C9-methyltransferase
MSQSSKRLSDYVTFNDADLKRQYADRRIPIATLIDAYIAGKIDIPGNIEDLINDRDLFVSYSFTPEHVKFAFGRMLPEVLIHSQEQDIRIAREHYDRGNDFFNWFLGERMIYTSAFFLTGDEPLEQAQDQKMNLVCNKMLLEEGETLLDIGCGWGTLAMHAAKHYGAKSTGITIAQQQVAFANDRIRELGLEGKAEVLCLDYRDIPTRTFDKISCLEMAEHVGVKNFRTFMKQIYSLLDDDGVFYLQIAGLRENARFEDLVWGLFMNRYIFPGADASTPLSFYVKNLEKAGFEVHSVETIGVHYSQTIYRWYKNWESNKEKVLAKYGEHWYRLFRFFLSWTVHIARQGSATCYQIVCHKNLNTFDRTRFFNRPGLGEQTGGAGLDKPFEAPRLHAVA